MTSPPLAPVLAALLALAPAPLQEPEPERAPEVPVRLVADLAAITPGCALEVGVHLRVPAGWHVYWANPGDTGMATDAQLVAPPGFRVEGPLFPGPVRHEDPGALVSFVHEGDLVLFFRVQVPDELPPGPLELNAEVRWLACKEACFVGSAEPQLLLPVGDATAPAEAATLELLARQRAMLPRPFEALGPDAVAAWIDVPVPEGERARHLFRLEVPAAQALEFFPGPAAPFETVRQGSQATRSGDSRRLEVELVARPGAEPGPGRILGVLRLEKDGAVTYVALDRTRRPAPTGGR
jgi:thiol:disulfide interchange protein DsbD